MVVVSDTSPIANLILIGELTILKAIFGQIYVPPSVDNEIIALEEFSISLESYKNADWIRVKEPFDNGWVTRLMEEIDVGESEAIVLAIELNSHYLLIDERIGTRKAKENGLSTIGLIGVLVKAKEKGIIDLIEPIINQLIEKAGFWLSEKLIERVLKEVGER